MRKIFLIGLLLTLVGWGSAQSTLTGKVFQVNENGDTMAVVNAAAQWLHTSIGTHTDADGKFTAADARLILRASVGLEPLAVPANTNADD